MGRYRIYITFGLWLSLAQRPEAFMAPAVRSTRHTAGSLASSATDESSSTSYKAPQGEIDRRRNLAIISHPDSGKTTMTERLLLYGGALQQAGAVRQKAEQRATASDFMAMEQERGISISSTVMNFEYEGYGIRLMDTPGHQDFSEDTYRALAAADNAVSRVVERLSSFVCSCSFRYSCLLLCLLSFPLLVYYSSCFWMEPRVSNRKPANFLKYAVCANYLSLPLSTSWIDPP